MMPLGECWGDATDDNTFLGEEHFDSEAPFTTAHRRCATERRHLVTQRALPRRGSTHNVLSTLACRRHATSFAQKSIGIVGACWPSTRPAPAYTIHPTPHASATHAPWGFRHFKALWPCRGLRPHTSETQFRSGCLTASSPHRHVNRRRR